MAGAIRIGTSGFSYKEWLGGFYPVKTPGAKMLAHYARRLPTVEINYTFRAMPKTAMLERWAAQTPAHFRFALKAPQRITHIARLSGAEESLEHFIEVSGALGDRLGPVLFQLPPDLKSDLNRLKNFLVAIRGRVRAAFEFRNPSWFDEAVFAALKEGGAALCIAESEKLATPIARTAPFVYVRMRKEGYDDAALRTWAERLQSFADGGAEVYAYLKHEDMAWQLAERLRAMLEGAL